METKVCPNCHGEKGENGLTGYKIYNAYDKTQEKFIVCESCNGTGIQNPDIQELSLSDLSLLLMEDAANA